MPLVQLEPVVAVDVVTDALVLVRLCLCICVCEHHQKYLICHLHWLSKAIQVPVNHLADRFIRQIIILITVSKHLVEEEEGAPTERCAPRLVERTS